MTTAQNRALEELWSEYGLEFARQAIDLDQAFGVPTDSTPAYVLEIGFGMGDSLFESLLEFPDSRFLGIEVHGPGVGHLMKLAASKRLPNLRVYRHDVIEVLKYCIADNCLDVVQIFFPDPWPKKKHRKRRLINSDFIRLVSRKLKDKGILHLATDWPSYAQQMRELVTDSNLFDVLKKGRARPQTKYERRAKDLGHSIVDLVYKKADPDCPK